MATLKAPSGREQPQTSDTPRRASPAESPASAPPDSRTDGPVCLQDGVALRLLLFCFLLLGLINLLDLLSVLWRR